MKVKDKIDSFQKTALKEAEEKRQQLLLEIDAAYKKACEEMTAKAELAFAETLKEEKYKALQSKNKDILQTTTEAKRSLIDLRTQLVDDLFDGVVNMITDFVEKDEYRERLLAGIAKTAALYQDGITVSVCERDMCYKEQICAIPGVDVVRGRDEMLGGYIAQIKGKSIIVDCSYSARLAEARASFGGFRITEQ